MNEEDLQHPRDVLLNFIRCLKSKEVATLSHLLYQIDNLNKSEGFFLYGCCFWRTELTTTSLKRSYLVTYHKGSVYYGFCNSFDLKLIDI